MVFRSKRPRIVPLNRGETLGGSTTLLLLDRVRPARGGRRFRRRRKARFLAAEERGWTWLPILLALGLLGLMLWAAAGLLDWGYVDSYLDEVWSRLTS